MERLHYRLQIMEAPRMYYLAKKLSLPFLLLSWLGEGSLDVGGRWKIYLLLLSDW